MVRTVIEIDGDLCNGCGQCVRGCHEGALQLIDGKARLIGDSLCDGLGACIGECPVGAIEFIEREATPYRESEVLERILPQGVNTVVAHLRHLHQHRMTSEVHEALAILDQAGWAVESIRRQVFGTSEKVAPVVPGGCPGNQIKDFSLRPNPAVSGPPNRGTSELRQWPVQLHLVPPSAPFLRDCDLLVAADCTPFAYANFHQDFLQERVLLVGCPKLDDTAAYTEKLTQIFSLNRVRSVMVLRMEVPCCAGISQAVRRALAASGEIVAYSEAVIGIDGARKYPQF